MKGKHYKPYLIFILIPLAVGALSSIFTIHGMPAYAQLVKPGFTPPPIAFPIVWNILYVLMGIGAARVWLSNAPEKSQAIFLFGAQLIINFFWSVLFFGMQLYFLAFVWLLLLIAAVGGMLWYFYQSDPLAGILQVPYLVWCVFAAVLNFCVWLLNH